MNAFTPEIFAAALGCLPCCTAPSGCSCALLIPIKSSSGLDPFGEPPYASYSDAATGISDFVYSCLMWAGWGVTPTTLDSASIAVTSIIAVTMNDSAVSVGGSAGRSIISLALKSGDTISIAASGSSNISPPFGNLLGASLYKCDGTFIDNDEVEGDSASLSLSVPDDGEYVLVLYIDIADGTTFTYSATVSFGDTWTINPVIALWDDSGTTRKLWACPKLLLPPSTEAGGDWYADCATANADLTSPQVSNCVGFADPASAPGAFTSFTATDGGSSLTLDILYPGITSVTQAMYGGVNAVAGQTLDFSFTSDAGVPFFGITIFDDEGNAIESGGRTSPYSSAALPYTGRYTVLVQAADLTPFPGVPTLTTANFVITSSGTMSVNPIQARYDLGLTCSGNLDCGDTCP